MKRHYKWAVVGMLWLICFFNYADRQAISSVMPKLQAEFGFSEEQQGWIFSGFKWVYAGSALLAGYIADRLSRKQLILGGCLFWSAATGLTGWCGRLWQFVAVRAVEGLGEAFYFPASMSLISDYHDKRTRSRAMSFHQSSVYFGAIGGSWFAAWLAEHYNWRWGFYFFGIMGILLAFALYAFLREPIRGAADLAAITGKEPSSIAQVLPPASLGVRETAREILGKPTAILLFAAFVCANSVAGIFLDWTPTFLGEKFGFKLAAAGLSAALFINIASACSVPLGGLLADRWAGRFAGGRMAVQALGLLGGAAFIVLVGQTTSKTTLIVSMTVFGLGKGLYDANIFASLYDTVHPRTRATAAGLMNTFGWGGSALGTVAFGYAVQYGPYGTKIENMSHAIAFGAIIYIVGAVLLLAAAYIISTPQARSVPSPR